MPFDPKKYREARQDRAQSSGNQDNRPIPAGEYLLALVWFQYQRDRNGHPLMRGKFVVCYGPGKGRGFFTMVSFNLRSFGAAGRIASWCACVGDESPLDERSAKAVAERFKFRVFKARVKARESTYNGRKEIRNEIDRFIPEMTDEEIAAADRWEEEDRAAREERRKGAGAVDPADHWYDDGRSNSADDGWNDDAPFPGDADAPAAKGPAGRRRERYGQGSGQSSGDFDDPTAGGAKSDANDDDIPW